MGFINEVMVPTLELGVGGAVGGGAIGALLGRFITHTGAARTAKVLAVIWCSTLAVSAFVSGTVSEIKQDGTSGKRTFVALFAASSATSIYFMRQYNIIAKTGTVAAAILLTAATLVVALIFLSEDEDPSDDQKPNLENIVKNLEFTEVK